MEIWSMIAHAKKDGARPLVAVVDDDPSVRKGLGRLLRSAGYAVKVFESGHDFISACADTRPTCLVLDIHMPGMTGYDVACQLSAHDTDIPLVIISAHEDALTRQWAEKMGPFLLKPFDGTDLVNAIQGAVSRRQGG
jgi:FixJ family two-component response regulator